MSTYPEDQVERPEASGESTKTKQLAEKPQIPAAAICPKCGIGKLRVTGFKANSERPTFQLRQANIYAHGRDNPPVSLECINPACTYEAERPGDPQMVGFLYPEP